MAEDTIGNYRLQSLLMTGQSSQVWEVVELSSHRHFAMKILLPEKATDRETRKMLAHEASVGKQLAHPNVIRIVNVSVNAKVPYYVMEFFPAGSIKLRIMHKKYDFIEEHALSILKQGATALAYMNESGWVHRDVKPDNFLVNSAGELRLIDFALAQRIQKDNFFRKLFRRKGPTQGTRSYMSPEQIRGLPLDGRADIYSFGASAYEILTYRTVFPSMTPQEVLQKHIIEKPISPDSFNRNLTREISDLILRMLAKKKEERPRNFHEVLMDLRKMKIYKQDPKKKE